MKGYILVDSERVLKAYVNFSKSRKARIAAGRKEVIRNLLSPRTGWFGIMLKPKCLNVRDAIRYMKTTQDDPFMGSYWVQCTNRGFNQACEFKQLADQASKQAQIYLDTEAAKILNWE